MKTLFKAYHRWLIWGLAAAFFFAEYFARVAPSVMVPELMQSFRVNALSLGALSAFFYYAYVSMQIPVGTLVDRFGAHRLLTLTAALCGIGCILFANTNHLAAAELGRFLMGLGAAFAFVGALKLAHLWFPAERFGFFAGATQALGMIGAAIGEGPVSVMVQNFGWRQTMWVIGLILIILAALIGLIVRDRPNQYLTKEGALAAPTSQGPGLLKGLMIVLKNPQTWINGLFVGFLYAPTAAFAELWGATYLDHVHEVSIDVAASAVSLIFIGWGIGSPIAGWLSDKMKRRKPILFFSALGSFLLMSTVLYFPHLSMKWIFVLLFLYGFANVGVATSYAVACEINPQALSGTSMSFANMASVLVGAGFQPIIGWLLDLNWDGKVLKGVPIYSAHDFHIALLALPVCFIISLLCWLFLRETYCGRQQ